MNYAEAMLAMARERISADSAGTAVNKATATGEAYIPATEFTLLYSQGAYALVKDPEHYLA